MKITWLPQLKRIIFFRYGRWHNIFMIEKKNEKKENIIIIINFKCVVSKYRGLSSSELLLINVLMGI